MNPYGSKPSWRCKDKFHPPPASGHVQGCNIPTLLRLDSTGEITSDHIPSKTERNNYSFQSMGTLIGSALPPFMKFGTKTAGASIGANRNNSHCLLNESINSEMTCLNNMMPSRSSPGCSVWGKNSDIPPCVAPHLAARHQFLSTLTPLFQSNAQRHEYKFHPAMATTHNVNKKFNRYRNSHPNGTVVKNGQINSPKLQKCDASVRSGEKETQHSGKKRDPSAVHVELQKPKETSTYKMNVGVKQQCNNSSSASKESNIHVLASTASESLKSSLSNCDIMKAAFQVKDIYVQDKTEKNEEKDDVPLDWFDGGYDSLELPSEFNDRISDFKDSVHPVGETIAKLSYELIDKQTNDTGVKTNSGLQRECSVISDIFDDKSVSLTCFINNDHENEDLKGDHEQSQKLTCDKSGVATNSHIATTVSVTCVLQDSNNVLVNSSPMCNKTPVLVTHSNRPYSSVDTIQEDNKSSTKALKDDHANSKIDHSFVLFVRDNGKKCRPSSKKRRQAKARKEKKESLNKKHGNCKEHAVEKTTNSQDKSTCNKVAFILGFDPSSCIPDQSHSFVMEFNESDSDFSDGSMDDDEDDDIDGLGEFSNPLDINVICSIKDSSKDLESESTDIAEINRSWKINVKVTPGQKSTSKKSDKKVHFAERDLCTIHPMIAWSYAYEAARKGPWEEYARDRERFQRRISDCENILAPVFNTERRERIYAKLNST